MDQLAFDGTDDVDVGGPEEVLPDDAAQIEIYAEKRMWRIRQLREEQAKNTAQADEIRAPLVARLEMVDTWLIEQNEQIQRSIDYLERQVEAAALAYPWGKQKSRKMPAGTFGKRTTPERLEVADKETVVAWAEAGGHTEMVRVTKAPDAKTLREYWQSTGTMPAGCEIVPAIERPYCKAGE